MDPDEIQKQVEDALMSEFDFDEIEESLEDMFPGEKISFQDVVIIADVRRAGEDRRAACRISLRIRCLMSFDITGTIWSISC